MKHVYSFTFLAIIIFGTACNGPVKKDKGSGSNAIAAAHPKLIKTIGSPRYGNVQCSLQDKAGNIWFGTTENGLYKYDGKSFARFLVTDGLSSNNIFSLLEDKDGKIWIGTEAGLCLYDGKAFTKIQIPLPKNLPPNKNPYYLNSHRVYSMMQARSGRIWFLTIDGIYVYDGKSLPTGQAGFNHFLLSKDANGFLTSNDQAEQILEDKDGNIWFGARTNKGVYKYDGKSVVNIKLEELSVYRPDSVRVGHSWGWPQVQDKDGNIWFSNWGGAYRYDGKSFKTFTKKEGLADNTVARIIEDKKGNIWIGGGGLTRYDGKSFTRFSTRDGLPNVGIWSILEDRSGNLWIGTRETGLFLYDGEKFTKYSEYKQ